MRVRIKKQKSFLENDNIKWYLMDEIIWITVYEEYSFIEENLYRLKGSYNLLYEGNDTVLFDEETGRFEIAIIDSLTIVTGNINDIKYCEMKGNIFLEGNERHHSFEFTPKVVYDKIRDNLVAVPEEKSEGLILLYITSDFGFFIDNGILCGWILKNASLHLYTKSEKKNACSDKVELLYEYISALEAWEIDCDDSVFDKIKNIVSQENDIVSLEIKKCIENILGF